MAPVKKVTAGGAILALIAGLFSFVFFMQPAAAVGTQTFNPTADTYVQADLPDNNFGSSVRWSTEGRANIWRSALLRFNVVVPDGERVTSAKLRAYSEAAATSTEFVDVYGSSGSWTESTVTWNTRPARSTWLGKTGNFTTGQWVEWDVTGWVGSDGGYTALELATNAQKWIGFKSKENTDPALKPQLVVTTETDTTTTPTPEPTGPAGEGTTAASVFNWGAVTAGDEFNYTGAPDSNKWSVYNSAGHAGNGLRSPSQASVNGSVFNIDGTADGTTAGMSAKFANQKYGRWESRIKASGDNEYHMVSILWPDSGNWPCDGEIDYAETTGDFSEVGFFHHFSCTNQQTQAHKTLDVTQWHNYAVDWSPTAVVGYVDGVEWFRDSTNLPPGSMHQTLQLDWFPDSTADGTGNMQVDWVRVYAASSTTEPTTPPTTPPPAGTGSSWKFDAVGDMNPSGTTSSTSASGKNAAAIKNDINAGTVANFIGLGDFQYSVGNCNNSSYPNDSFSKWEAQWGPLKAKTYWIGAPNHDYQPGRNIDLGTWMNGGCVSTTKSATNTTLNRYHDPLEWYAFDKGNWHIVAAPTATWRYNPSRAAAMTQEMKDDILAAKANGKHIMALYHDPYYTSRTSDHNREYDVKPWTDMFYDTGVRLTLSGSQHNYERSCYVDKNDACKTDGTGVQAFNVSTGGIGLRSFPDPKPSFIAHRFSDTWGYIQIDLKDDGSYTWNYKPTSGGMQTDSGTRAANQ
jgi:hypothetical protein